MTPNENPAAPAAPRDDGKRQVWFTSDTHYGHAAVIDFCHRPFKTLEEMDEGLIARFNERVQPGDTVYHLGDFCFAKRERCESILKRLNGQKFLIAGNHDETGRKAKGWAWVGDYKQITVALPDPSTPVYAIVDGGPGTLLLGHEGEYEHPSVKMSPGPFAPEYSVKVVLCHYAMRVWRNSHHGALMLYGHSHGSLPGDSQSLDVGVDCWDMRPVNMTEILERLTRNPAHKHLDHHQPGMSASWEKPTVVFNGRGEHDE